MKEAPPPLLPRPRSYAPRPGECTLPLGGANSIQATLDPASGPPQSYRLTIDPGGPRLVAADAAGAFYGRMTLRQLARLSPGALPCCEIADSPDLPVRGVMLDVSRDKVPKMETLFALVDRLAEWKVNHLQLYMEHTFAYAGHREVWAEASPFTPEEIRSLDACCRARFIELAPNQNAFGHCERWLKHPRYRPLAECPDGYRTPSGEWRDTPATLAPSDPAVLALLDELFGELLPCFTSRRFHVGCDETWELGKGRSAPEAGRRGLGPVFLDHLGRLRDLAARHGRTALYWGDMVWNHFPDRLADLDPGMIHVDWGYYRNYPFQEHGEKLAAAGLPFWFAPGTSTWGALVGCNEAAFGSNRSAARAALSCGAGGLLNTDWGDGGHWQYLAESEIGLAAGAAMAWCEKANPDEAIRAALDPQVFRDPAGVMGKAALALADTWEKVTENATQANLLDRILRQGADFRPPANMSVSTLKAAEDHLQRHLAELKGACPLRADGALLLDEFANNGRMALLACRMGQRLLDGKPPLEAALAPEFELLVAEHRRLWLARNRPGGLADSVRLFEQRLAECRNAGGQA